MLSHVSGIIAKQDEHEHDALVAVKAAAHTVLQLNGIEWQEGPSPQGPENCKSVFFCHIPPLPADCSDAVPASFRSLFWCHAMSILSL
jgi:hypothetical protein